MRAMSSSRLCGRHSAPADLVRDLPLATFNTEDFADYVDHAAAMVDAPRAIRGRPSGLKGPRSLRDGLPAAPDPVVRTITLATDKGYPDVLLTDEAFHWGLLRRLTRTPPASGGG
jgi:hypothetical protein